MFISNTPASFHLNQYHVIVSGTCPSPVTSTAGVLNVGQITLNTQPPASTIVCENANTTISVGATGNSLVYQWQVSTDGGGTWNPISNGGVYSGADTPDLAITGATNAMNTWQYHVVIGSVACPSATSNASTLTVNPILAASVSIVANPGDVICDGTSVDFTATPVNGGSTPAYQWYLNGAPVGTNSATYTDASLTNTDAVYVEMSSNANCALPVPATSNTINMTVNPILPVSVSIATASTTVCDGSSVTFSATPTNGGGSPSYQWYLNSAPVGTDSDTYITSALSDGDVLECVLTSSETCQSGGPASSNTLTMTVQFEGQWLGYTNDWETPGNWGCGVLPTSTTVVVIPTSPVGGSFPEVYSAGNATALDLNLQPGASVNLTSGNDVSIFGDLINNGVASLGAGAVKFRGTNAHLITGSTNTDFGTLEVSNTSAGTAVLLDQSITVSNTVQMTLGSLNLSGFDIDLGTTGQVVNETNGNRIFGAGEIKATRTLAASTAYNNIAGIGLSITTDAVAPMQTDFARGHISQVVGGTNNSIQRYFDISPTVNTSLNATLKFFYFQDEIADIDGIDPSEDQLIPWRSEDNGLTWEGQHYPAQLSNDNVANWVQLTQIPAFSKWTLSDWLTEPLPIELLSFTATPTEHTVDLEWTTLSEVNNDFFTVERSADAINFTEVLTKDGAGNSTVVRNYSDTDYNPLQGISYYRLKQTDFNGTSEYSQIVPVYFGNRVTPAVTSFVNADRDISLSIDALVSENASIRVFDLSGKLIMEFNAGLNEGKQSYMIPNPGLATGVYLLSVQAEHLQHVQKLVIR